MKFVTVRDFRTSPSSIWKRLPVEREMGITNNGKPIALLTPLSDETLEDTVSAARKAMAINTVKKMQEISVSLGNDKKTLDEITLINNPAAERRGCWFYKEIYYTWGLLPICRRGHNNWTALKSGVLNPTANKKCRNGK
jgi:antitoxin (DNA-binding transcriptional repressor) of toxin-antitoxin stability system